MKTDNILMAYMTFPNRETADRIAQELVNKQLVACVNLFDATSHYQWDGDTVQEDEIIGVAKTVSTQKEQLEERFTRLHPYDTPCLVFYEADGGLPDYTDWVRGQCQSGHD